jgi:hypothetical protein
MLVGCQIYSKLNWILMSTVTYVYHQLVYQIYISKCYINDWTPQYSKILWNTIWEECWRIELEICTPLRDRDYSTSDRTRSCPRRVRIRKYLNSTRCNCDRYLGETEV